MNTLAKGALIALSALLAWIMGLPHAILILAAVQVLDVMAGISVAWGEHSISSAIASVGIRKKIFAWIIILLVGILQFELSEYFPIRVVLNYTPMEVAALGFVVVESISILENADKLGLWLPTWLRKGLAIAQDTFDGEDEAQS